MSEYQEPIRIPHDDPICSVSAMNGTIVGVLFEKTGAEVRKAMQSRVEAINSKVDSYRVKVDDVEKFLKGKEEDLDKIEKFYTDRADAKRALSRPFERRVEDIRKELQDKVFEFDKATEKDVADKAVEFEKGFEGMADNFKEIDDILEKESEVRDRSMLRGSTGSAGMTGMRCITDSASSGDNSGFMTYNSADFEADNIGVGDSSPTHIFNVTQQEDEALARLNTLKATVNTYARRIEVILAKICELDEEKRRLQLMQRHLVEDFKYKLDLNKLSAFGFEDLKVA